MPSETVTSETVTSEPVDRPDTRFSLPAIDDPASTEVGVILLGLAADQLLAGLGLAALAEDPTAITLLVDQIRHGGAATLTLERLVSLGLHRWQQERDAPALAAGRGAPLRQAWAQVYQAVLDRQLTAPASTAYLTACLLRSAEIDGYAGLGRRTTVRSE